MLVRTLDDGRAEIGLDVIESGTSVVAVTEGVAVNAAATVWIDCGAGASGDMLLGALHSAGVPLQVIADAVYAVAPEAVEIRTEPVVRNGLAATKVTIHGTESHVHRTWSDVRALLDSAALPENVRDRAHDAFRRLAEAEATVHATTPDAIHFHEVGALDAIADVVGVCAGFAQLGADTVVASPVAVGSGTVRAAHGELPVPVPAVVELLKQAPTHSGQLGDVAVGELCTPTGAALLRAHVREWGPQPPMRVLAQGIGAGSKDIDGRANVVRLCYGEAARGDGTVSTQHVLETNVDDLDPRLWPTVLARLMDAGAADAWLTPILMKKGRPGHTLSVLVDDRSAAAVRRVVFAETTAIGLRSSAVGKHALPRTVRTVEVEGTPVRVKISFVEGGGVTVQPEYDDVLAAAERSGRPVGSVLNTARAAAERFTETDDPNGP